MTLVREPKFRLPPSPFKVSEMPAETGHSPSSCRFVRCGISLTHLLISKAHSVVVPARGKVALQLHSLQGRRDSICDWRPCTHHHGDGPLEMGSRHSDGMEVLLSTAKTRNECGLIVPQGRFFQNDIPLLLLSRRLRVLRLAHGP